MTWLSRKIAKHHHFSDTWSNNGPENWHTFKLVDTVEKVICSYFSDAECHLWPRNFVTCTHFRKLDLIYRAGKLWVLIFWTLARCLYGLVNSPKRNVCSISETWVHEFAKSTKNLMWFQRVPEAQSGGLGARKIAPRTCFVKVRCHLRSG